MKRAVNDSVDLSIVIVSLNAEIVLQECLSSLKRGVHVSHEIIVVDNGSVDGTADMLGAQFPNVVLIHNSRNEGFVRATNQALSVARGRYYLLLNPDTIVMPGATDALLSLMRCTPGAGIVGPKVLNRDGTFQPQCKRGVPTPLAAFGYFSGLGHLFPENRKLNQYLLSYLDQDAASPVYAVSGCCLLARREMVKQVGFLDEVYFAYGEDLDWCHRAHEAGWSVHYEPTARIVHLGGQGGSAAQPGRALYHWHRSMWIFYRKHLRYQYPFVLTWLVGIAIAGKLGLSLVVNALRSGWVVGSRKP